MFTALIILSFFLLALSFKLWMLSGRIDFLACRFIEHLREDHGEEP